MELSVQRPQQLGKAHTAIRKVRREILRQRLSPPQKRRAGIVEGVVRVGIVGLPAVAPQGTVPADLLRRPVKQHGGVLRPQQRRVVLQAVIHRPEGRRRCRGLRRHLSGGRQQRSLLFRQQQPHTGSGQQLAQHRQRADLPQQQGRQHTRSAEGRGRRHSLSAPQPCGSGRGGAQHHRQIQLSRAAQVQRQPRQRTGGRRVGHRPAAHKIQQQHRCQHSRR